MSQSYLVGGSPHAENPQFLPALSVKRRLYVHLGMSPGRNRIDLDGKMSRRLWLEASDAATENIPIEDPRDDQLLAWVLANYLDVDLRVASAAKRAYHTEDECPKYPGNETFVVESAHRECHYCNDDSETHDFAQQLRERAD